MPAVTRVLDARPVASLAEYTDTGGGSGFDAAIKLGPGGVIEHLAASGLRGRGGGGFPTGTKWQTVAANTSPEVPATVVVNGAEGEPGSFKDRAILRANPYRVLEGALIAARAIGADRVVVALKASFATETGRVRAAVREIESAGWTEGIAFEVVGGPDEYLYGEETALLEVLAGRAPFPRIAPPFRHGADEVPAEAAATSPAASGGAPAAVEMAGPDVATQAPPTLVNNVETMANVAGIVADGPDWFRSVGTRASPGTVVCTITGRTQRHGVGEFAMGTPLTEVIEALGGGPVEGRRIVAVMSGVANPLVPGEMLDTPVSYEAMEAAGTGLGAAGFIVFDDTTDPVAVAHGVSRFLAVESCGQCTPCKQDGLALAELLDRLRRSEVGDDDDVARVKDHLATVTDGARCFLAHQQQRVLESVLALFPAAVRAHADGIADPADVEVIAPIVDLVDGNAVLDDGHLGKQPDWTFGDTYSGQSPADRIDQGGA